MADVILRPEPYNPDAVDADGDGIVQERTAWERPAGTRILDAIGSAIETGRSLTSRPAGLRIVDANGNEVKYRPSYEGAVNVGKRPTSALSDHGFLSLAERGIPTIGQSLQKIDVSTVRSITAPPAPPTDEEIRTGNIRSELQRIIGRIGTPDRNWDVLPGDVQIERTKMEEALSKILETVDTPEERTLLSSMAFGGLYWASTALNLDGGLLEAVNTMWSGAQDADTNPHQFLEDLFQNGGFFAITYPLQALKSRYQLTRKQMESVAAGAKKWFEEKKLQAGEFSDALKKRLGEQMIRLQTFLRKGRKPLKGEMRPKAEFESITNLLNNVKPQYLMLSGIAADDGELPESPIEKIKSRWRKLTSFDRELQDGPIRDPRSLFLRPQTEEEKKRSTLANAMAAWRSSFGQSYMIEQAAKLPYDESYFESRWASALVDAISTAPVQPYSMRVDSRTFTEGQIVDFPLIASGAKSEEVRGFETFNDVLGASAPRATWITFKNAPSLAYEDQREFILSGRFRVDRIDDYNPPWANKPGSPVALRGKRKMVTMEYLGPSEEIKINKPEYSLDLIPVGTKVRDWPTALDADGNLRSLEAEKYIHEQDGNLEEIPDDILIETILDSDLVDEQGRPTAIDKVLYQDAYYYDGENMQNNAGLSNKRFDMVLVQNDDPTAYGIWAVWKIKDKKNGKEYFLKASQYGVHDALLERVSSDVSAALGFAYSPEFRNVHIQGQHGVAQFAGNIRWTLMPHIRDSITDASTGPDGNPQEFANVAQILASEAGPSFSEDVGRIAAMDYLIGNLDRHQGNIMAYKDQDDEWRLYPIDHGLAFGGRTKEAYPINPDDETLGESVTQFVYDSMYFAPDYYATEGTNTLRRLFDNPNKPRNRIRRMVRPDFFVDSNLAQNSLEETLVRAELIDANELFDVGRLEKNGTRLTESELRHLEVAKEMFIARRKLLRQVLEDDPELIAYLWNGEY